MARLRSKHDREIVRLAFPALGALAAEPLYLLTDTAIVGHLATTERGCSSSSRSCWTRWRSRVR